MGINQQDTLTILKLYELRRDEKKREARSYFFTEFRLQTALDSVKLLINREKERAYFQMITSCLASKTFIFLLLIFLLGEFVVFGKPNTLVIKNVRIFDGSKILEANTVIVENGQIVSVGKDLFSSKEGTEVIDGTGNTLLPGLIDAHVHYVSPRNLRQAAFFGITTVLDMGGDYKLTSQAKAQQSQSFNSSDLFSAGTLITAPGGHGTEYGLKIPTISSANEAESFIDARLNEGSDYIKIVYDDGKTYQPIPTISLETLKTLIKVIHNRGKMAVVHAISYREAREAIEAGGNGLMHLFVDRKPDKNFGQFAAKHKIFVNPTLGVLQDICGFHTSTILTDQRLTQFLTDRDIADLKTSLPIKPAKPPIYNAAKETLQQMKINEVPIIAGSDASGVHGVPLHEELELLTQAGLSPIEALRAATSTTAKVFNLNDRGVIAPLKRADLLLVKGDPTKDIKDLRNISRVWKNGVQIDRIAYQNSIKPAKDEEARLRQAPLPKGAESGLISDFETNPLSSKFGSGWSISTDSLIGGKSIAELKLNGEGANGSHGSLLIEGEIIKGYPFPWSGAQFVPGESANKPANLSSKKKISFWAKGDGKTYRVQIFARSYGYIKPTKEFVASKKWKKYTFNISDFDGMEGYDVLGVLFVAGAEMGKFAFQIDEVWLQ